ncbi:DNA mismatch repair endonuclease MutL [Halopenitus sp. H-Gu1]|uniref:DNA mismatch repair endonuclease MutL n=1 Tax=Halopenitus sp. H-Gu1 TaxID=3242697 RepID=UPI00359D21AB
MYEDDGIDEDGVTNGMDADPGSPSSGSRTEAKAESGSGSDPAPSAIRPLDERTVQRIAAGEVVERPASIVKELVENALDADASRIAVSVEGGGTDRIRVRDDGIGIPASQLPEAVAEHATSKIDDIDDLEAGVGTLGFRGEALYTVGAVSRLTLRSRPRPEAHGDSSGRTETEADTGAEITVEGGEVGEIRPAGCPVGTTVEVEDVFYNTPAREKFLKTDATEFDHVNRVLTQYALANPDVAVSLEHDGRETFATEGNGDLESAVLAVYGRDVAKSMRPVEWQPADERMTGEEVPPESLPDETPVGRVHGLVSHPETTRASREYLSTFVNGRYVTAGALRNAVIEAYGGQLASDRYPFAVLFVEVPPETVDVNVHPRKLEVRFDAESAVREAVETAVETALLEHGLIRSTAPRGRSAPTETAIEPQRADTEVRGGAATTDGRDRETELEQNRNPESDRNQGSNSEHDRTLDPESVSNQEDRTGDASEIDPNDEDAWSVEGLTDPGTSLGSEDEVGTDDPSGETGGSVETSTSEGATGGVDPTGTDRNTQEGSERKHAHTDTSDRKTANASPSPRTWQRDEVTDSGSSENVATTSEQEMSDGLTDRESQGGTTTETERVPSIATPNEQGTLDGETTTAEIERDFESLPRLRVLGQLHETYVVAEASEGLVLIDQHAADERVNYERLREVFADGMDAQALAEPVTVELTAREAALFAEFNEELRGIGFRTERASDREVVVSAVPAVFDATLDPGLLRDVLGSLVEEGTDDAEPVEDVVDGLVADLACYPSVTGNTSLREGSVLELLAALDECENPYACPHGRPVIIEFDREEIEDRFERDYPGHVGRRTE